MKPIKVIAMSVAVPTVLGLAACGSSSGSSPNKARASSAVASAEASLKNNPQLQKDLTDAYTEISACAKSQEGLIVTIPVPDSGEKPSVSQVSYHVVRHPIESFQKIIACTPEGQHKGKTAEAQVKVIIRRNGLGKGKLGQDVNDIAHYLATGQQ
jgi:hypothetical protein